MSGNEELPSADGQQRLPAAGIVEVERQTRRRPRLESQFAAAVGLREQLYDVFGSVAAGRDPKGASLTAVVRRAGSAALS